ncbi:MAG: hypothetical protein NWE91_03880 [Candidatus Bathyarchaeota archaeon]|nr:hypothetical protein [Candidatus Bathyarchaeota archaeon]
MYNRHRILAVIPARGGSKGIPRKNVRLLAGKPLIAYSIQTALNSNYVDDVIVSTEDEKIMQIAGIYGANIVERPIELAGDDVPLDPVIYHALTHIEKDKGLTYDYIISMQPTSPLLKEETLDRAIVEFENSKRETLITVRNETHLYWRKKDGILLPLFKERRNRQFLDPIYKETGALFISRRDVITKKNRIGNDIYLFELPFNESIDIDKYQDWWVAENLLRRITVVFRVDGDNSIGLGHVYRAITLASQMFNQNIYFLMDKTKKLGIEKVAEYNYPIIMIENERDVFLQLDKISPQIVINDILDTPADYISKLKERAFFVVNFEDLGRGSKQADLVINALYEKTEPPENSYYGYKYICLRDEFHIFPPNDTNQEANKILILFGGSDPNNLTLRSLKAIQTLSLKNIALLIILGLGYNFKNELYTYVNNLKKNGSNIEVKENVEIIAKIMSEADLVLTSNGRTIYEVAAMGVPCISISQNEREVRHLFSHTCQGILDLGIESRVTEEDIALALRGIINNYELRRKMSEALKNFNLREVTDRCIKLIFNKYWESKFETN